ncbi:unnamed protein product [Clonostachys rosea]|uniref:Alpha/beta hydrolase fold-3 domain-containing protein n=1 Tax=Bionectria ochroleuca TaxID=29856 RepID=A0ABY6U2C9_BIOOC|nr:unnamed protein product [Clonostachys rosea]
MPSFLESMRTKCHAYFVRKVAKRAQRNGYTLESPTQRQLIKIPSRDRGRSIRIWAYAHPDWERSLKRPVLVNWHGSGFTVGGFGLDHVWCTQVAHDLGMWVIDADYRKGPEDPFPAAVHDAEDVLRWVSSRPDLFDLTRVAVSGFASGGTLALVAASTLRRQIQGINIRIPVVFYPVTNYDVDPAEKEPPRRERFVPLPTTTVRFFNKCYLPKGIDRGDPRVSPDMSDLEAFPDYVVIITAEYDMFAPEALELAGNLRNGRRTVVSLMQRGVNHGFDKSPANASHEERRRGFAYAMGVDHLQNALRSFPIYNPHLARHVGDAERLRAVLQDPYPGYDHSRMNQRLNNQRFRIIERV